jgi:hypothetical protein
LFLFLSIVAFGSAATAARAQSPTLEWVQRANSSGAVDDRLFEMRVGPDGGVTVTGYSNGQTVAYLTTLHYDANGGEQWATAIPLAIPYIGNPIFTEAAMAMDENGDAYVTGAVPDGDGAWFWPLMLTAKIDQAGAIKWLHVIPPEGAYTAGYGAAIAVAPDGGVVVGGGMDYNIKLPFFFTLVKYDSGGALAWDKMYAPLLNGENAETPGAMAIDASGEIWLVGGAYQGNDQYARFCTLKANADGAKNWIEYLPTFGSTDDYALDVAVDQQQNAYVVGSVNGAYTLAKYTADGGLVYEKNEAAGEAAAVVLTPQGKVAVTGTSALNVGDTCTTIVYSPAGAIVWQANERGPNQEFCAAKAVAVDAAGNVYVAGSLNTSRASSDIYVIKYSVAGDLVWTARYHGGAAGENTSRRIAVDGLSVYVGGTSAGGGTGLDFVTLKYSQECDGCLIDLVCYADGQPNPQNSCERCDLGQSGSEWTVAADGAACDDGLFCNGADQCANGQCAAHAGDPCVPPATCSEEQDTCVAADDDVLDDDATDDDVSADDDATDDDASVDDDAAGDDSSSGGGDNSSCGC